MNKRNLMIKWSLYGICLLLVLLIQILITNRISIFGVHPVLIPLAVVIVATLEGSVGGAGFGLYAGILSFSAFYEAGILIILLYPIVGLVTGLIAEYILQSNFFCSLFCSIGYLGIFELWNVVPHLLGGTPLSILLKITLPELFYSTFIFFFLYALFRAVFRRVGGTWT